MFKNLFLNLYQIEFLKKTCTISEILESYNNIALALYRFPNESLIHYVIDDAPLEDKLSLDDFKGFVFQSFDKARSIGLRDRVSGVFENFDQSFKLDFIPSEPVIAEDDQFISSSVYTNTILDALDNIDKGHFSKVVLSRPLYTEAMSYSSALMLWNEMVGGYPNAFVSLVKLPNGSIWIGASPELLIQQHKDFYQTSSLAGTKWGETDPKKVEWTDKEKREQKIVTDYIEEKLIEEFPAVDIELNGPITFPSGHLFHLKTDIKIKAVNSTDRLVDVLHPTPAVCGQPKGNSLDFIRMYEGYDRKFYSGYLGPVNMGNSTRLFVNLRCAELFDDGSSIYVGGGIVKRSNPKKEWEETEEKARVIKNLLKA